MSIFTKIFGDPNEKYLKKLQPLVERINLLESSFEKFSNEKLKEKTQEFKERLRKGETLDDLLPEAFALVREAAKRTLGQRHFDVQLMGGIVLHQGKIAEMKTGEGKTLAATLPLYLNALTGRGCHLVTVNDYLARRDTVWMGQIYHALGLNVGCLNHEQSFLYDPEYKKPPEEKEKLRDELGSFYVVEDFLRPCSRKEAYLADITYGTNSEFGFDYLRDNMAYNLKDRVQRDFYYAILDEIDFILIDEARTPLIISAPDTESSKWYKEFAKIIPRLEKDKDYEIDEKLKVVTLTEDGISKVEKILGMENIYTQRGLRYLHYLEQALRAHTLFKRDRDYIVKDGRVIIVDEFTGRLMPGRRWSKGLHQAIEAKEGVEVRPESITLASITYQNFFRMYEKLAGMTGTAATSAEEFEKVYNLEVVIIPTNKPMIRKDLPDKVYKTEKGKLEAVIEEIKRRHELGQPILVGTRSVEKNERLSVLLKRARIPHQVLNAKNHQREGEIIAQAGRLGAVTVATNMAGRGVDIILGGNPPDPIESQKVKELGGLHVIGTERHEARRIDDQLRGRAGRQGDPGSSQFFLSLEDELLRIFGGEKVKSLMSALKIPETEPIEANIISKVVESSQAKIEGIHFDARKHLLEYDDVLNKHREAIYKKRKEILKKSKIQNPNDKNSLRLYILEIIKKYGYKEEDYKRKEKELGAGRLREIEKFICLQVIDGLWMQHLEEMEYLRDAVKLRAYGHLDPLVEYKREANKLFKQLLETIELAIAQTLMKVEVRPQNSLLSFSQPSFSTSSQNSPQRVKRKVGRNDPCPCGSGKKYKKCCWPKYG
ncbi:preprotein translocase subunit SecA [bacterium]|nr:preprotein translocase subunit SecA [bacterium]